MRARKNGRICSESSHAEPDQRPPVWMSITVISKSSARKFNLSVFRRCTIRRHSSSIALARPADTTNETQTMRAEDKLKTSEGGQAPLPVQYYDSASKLAMAFHPAHAPPAPELGSWRLDCAGHLNQETI